jgi:hypothetical protein
MATAFLSVVTILVFGLAFNFVQPGLMVLGGKLGVMAAGPFQPRPGWITRFNIGGVIAGLGQSYVNLTVVAMLVDWISHLGAIRFGLWPLGFLIVAYATWTTLGQTMHEQSEAHVPSAHTQGMVLTLPLTLLGFLVFIFLPSVMRAAWGWALIKALE